MQTLWMDMTAGIQAEDMEKAGQILKDGGLVAFPTETVYGLGGNGLDAGAAQKIYAAKGRPSDNPLIIHIAQWEDLVPITSHIPEKAKVLADAFWPGPLTMILPKSDLVPMETTGGLNTVAVRMPGHKAALELIRAGGGYIAAPSANTSGRPSPTTAAHVREDLDGKIDAIIDGGEVGIGLESTIVDLTEEVPVILRPGYISAQMLSEVIGEVRMDRAFVSADPSIRPKAPGMKYRHYAPKAQLQIVEGPEEKVVETINELAANAAAQGQLVGIIATDATKERYENAIIRSAGDRTDDITIAAHLYGLLREFDELGVSEIYSEALDTPRLGQAIMNRLIKAAGHRILQV
ncbi:MAG: L-threonylcarbamoyladenylate synthase [Lachnospiraceae bacterium]|nr:L-threonylcarbamoyladenylate synthase [Lachnospiraceae bacterium]